MAKQIVVSLEGVESRFEFSRLSREKLYGSRRRITLDHDGQPCERASLTRDGSLIVRKGMTAQGYFDGGGQPVARADLVGIDADGALVERKPSTLDEPQVLVGPVPPEELLDVPAQFVYLLDETDVDEDLLKRLKAGEIFRFPFNYYAGFERLTGFLVANAEGLFTVIGHRVEPVWAEPAVIPEDVYEDKLLDDDDLDFDML